MKKQKRGVVMDVRGDHQESVSKLLSPADADGEAAAWAKVSALAQSSLTFWNAFLGLQSGSSPLDSGGLARVTCILRAV